MTEPTYYLVEDDDSKWPTEQHLEHGYEDEWDYFRAIKRLVNRWKGRVGERIGDRNDFVLLSFPDTPGGKPDLAWLPVFILRRTAEPDFLKDKNPDEIALDQAFGFEDK